MIADIHQATGHGIRRICTTLCVPRSSYNHAAAPTATQSSDQEIGEKIEIIFKHQRRRYGYRRIQDELSDQGIVCAPCRVRRIMHERSLNALQPSLRPVSTLLTETKSVQKSVAPQCALTQLEKVGRQGENHCISRRNRSGMGSACIEIQVFFRERPGFSSRPSFCLVYAAAERIQRVQNQRRADRPRYPQRMYQSLLLLYRRAHASFLPRRNPHSTLLHRSRRHPEPPRHCRR